MTAATRGGAILRACGRALVRAVHWIGSSWRTQPRTQYLVSMVLDGYAQVPREMRRSAITLALFRSREKLDRVLRLCETWDPDFRVCAEIPEIGVIAVDANDESCQILSGSEAVFQMVVGSVVRCPIPLLIIEDQAEA